MKDDIDTRFEGGPYNGNSFNVSPELDQYEISSHGASHSSQHIYIRKGDKFVYNRTENHDSPQ